jgi:hypothetical protein
MLDERVDHRDVLGRERHPRRDRVDDLRSHFGVVPRIALADVVQQRADEEQVGSRDITQELPGVHHRLQQVPVDGVGVESVPLRLAPHRPPLGQHPREEVVALERLDRVDEVRPRAEQAHQRLSGALRPLLAFVAGDAGQREQRPSADRVALARCRRGQPEQQRLVGVGLAEIHLDLVVDDRDAGEQLRRPLSRAAEPIEPPPEAFARPVDRARRGCDARHQHIGVGEAHRLGDGVLVLQQQHVRRVAGDAVQLTADREQELAR